jgi:prepilin-type N-terminal cleavage/methylation domain-containing protein
MEYFKHNRASTSAEGMAPDMRRGFTLIELSIVLVIIGLIISGVLVGKDLVKGAEIRAQIGQIQEYETAYNTFKLKYGCIAGDCANATSFFSGTSNGNGNDKFDVDADNIGSVGEHTRFFQQLSLAQLTKGNYDGTSSFPNGYPRLAMYPEKGMCVANQVSSALGQANHYQLTAATMGELRSAALYLNIANPTLISSSGHNDMNAIFSPLDMQSLDAKIDDGKARTGKFRGFKVMGGASCLTADDGDYLSTNAITCDAEYILRY